jgi:glycosyltransferase involved in cell wall biosynthesis
MAHRPHIVFVNRFYRPDQSATAQILTDLAEALAARGWRVTVIASRQLYGDPRARLAARETLGGVAVRRVWTSRFGRAGIIGRMADYASFYLSAAIAMLGIVRRGDILVTKTDPPLLSVLGLPVARLRGARSITWLQDLYPEVAAELGMNALRGRAGTLLRMLRNWSLEGSDLNVVIGERMSERLVAEGIPSSRVTVMPNWSDDEAVRPLARDACALRDEWAIGDRFVVAYSGNLGRAHEVETMLGAARRLRGRDDIIFLMIGAGHASDQLSATVALERLDNVLFRPYQPRERLAESLAVGDLHWLSLRPEMEGLIVPSKFYGIAAAGRPVIAVTDPDGEVARLVMRHGCGEVVAPGDPERLAEVILTYASDAERCLRAGTAARTMLVDHFRRSDLLAAWDGLFADLPSAAYRAVH